MTQWLVKDLSKLTGVSVQTLHYYDKIDLLKPSLRLANAYRVYSEKDLLKLQQIIALKFFGFELAQIKILLAQESNVLKQFHSQAKVLEQKASALFDGARTLRNIIESVADNKSIPWETIIQMIEVYRMTEHLEHSWVKEIYTPEELKQYIEFEQQMKGGKVPEQKASFEKKWHQLLRELKKNLNQDPSSEIGIELGRKYITWVNEVYGKKYAHLRTKKWEQGFASGKGLEDVGLTPEIVSWIEQAMDAYWQKRLYGILDQIGIATDKVVLAQWQQALDDMYGDETERKQAVYEAVLTDKNLNAKAKSWLKSFDRF